MELVSRKFSIPNSLSGGPSATIMVAPAPQKNAPKPSKSLFNNPLIVNALVATAPQMQPLQTTLAFTGVFI